MTTFNIIMIAVLFFLSGVNVAFSFKGENMWSFHIFVITFAGGCYSVYETIRLLP